MAVSSGGNSPTREVTPEIKNRAIREDRPFLFFLNHRHHSQKLSPFQVRSSWSKGLRINTIKTSKMP